MQETRRMADMLMMGLGEHHLRVRGRVVARWKLREREFCRGLVFNVALHEELGASAAAEPEDADAILYFRDERAEACSFIEVGDIVSLDSVLVEQNPAAPVGPAGTTSAGQGPRAATGGKPLLPTQRLLVCPEGATVVVVQRGGDGELLELTLRSSAREPQARVLPADALAGLASYSSNPTRRIFSSAARGVAD
eukprot:TRINITY_DN34090_c0_g1_i1.p2 TRINITY_DN34090_c0_g1~~TRINITY_DN34090_c0_g1_i1.p2  ORF type:complete len:221 (+),score=68.21 TRINITY_DN34090_c0_g1_i1:82-663(+)